MANSTKKKRLRSPDETTCIAEEEPSSNKRSFRPLSYFSNGQCSEELEQLAYMDQGEHEMEFCAGDESELLKKRTLCDKDLTHDEFIPVIDFNLGCLPEGYREDHAALELIQAVADVTVRLVVQGTSVDRPDGYTCNKIRGKPRLKRYGSGWVWSAFRKFSTIDSETCPCRECTENAETARRQWGQFIVRTAKHVVFDDFEATNTTCELHYNSEDVRGKCEKLVGVEVWMSDIDGDFSEMTCITHDQNVSGKLEQMVGRYRDFFYQLDGKGVRAQNTLPRPVVVISHPHGCSKQVTVGVMTEERDDYPRNWTYTTRTCPGSSGGPVLRLGDWSILSRVPPHSGSKKLEVNYSCEPWLF